MKDFANYLGLPVFLLLSTWGAIATVLQAVTQLNAVRDFALGIGENAKDVPPAVRIHIFEADWLGLFVGIAVALAVYGFVLALVPRLFKDIRNALKREADERVWLDVLLRPRAAGLGHPHLACYTLAFFATVVMVVHVISGISDWTYVHEHVR